MSPFVSQVYSSRSLLSSVGIFYADTDSCRSTCVAHQSVPFGACRRASYDRGTFCGTNEHYSDIQRMSTDIATLVPSNRAASQLFVGPAYEFIHRIYHQCS